MQKGNGTVRNRQRYLRETPGVPAAIARGKLLLHCGTCCCQTRKIYKCPQMSNRFCVYTTNGFTTFINIVVQETVSPPQNQLDEKEARLGLQYITA